MQRFTIVLVSVLTIQTGLPGQEEHKGEKSFPINMVAPNKRPDWKFKVVELQAVGKALDVTTKSCRVESTTVNDKAYTIWALKVEATCGREGQLFYGDWIIVKFDDKILGHLGKGLWDGKHTDSSGRDALPLLTKNAPQAAGYLLFVGPKELSTKGFTVQFLDYDAIKVKPGSGKK